MVDSMRLIAIAENSEVKRSVVEILEKTVGPLLVSIAWLMDC
ncbi:hypothetical protein [uncultured Sphaerochaeta sp.]|nr:hypothetical protein [uncultured Sphaerochaeta sp.]